MKKQVIISLEEYNFLINIKETIENNGCYTIRYSRFGDREYFYTKDDGIIKIMEANNSLHKEIEDLKLQILNYKEPIKKMSLWEFYKWRKT